jgi:hypothetical protein
MGKYISCFQYKITPKIYKKKYNIDIKYEKQNTSFCVASDQRAKLSTTNFSDVLWSSEKFGRRSAKLAFYKKNKSYEDINLLTNSISPLSRHSHRKAKSMDCLFSQI